MRGGYFLIIFPIFGISTVIFSQNASHTPSDLIRLILSRSIDVRDRTLQAAQSDTQLKRLEGQYATRPYAVISGDSRHNRLDSNVYGPNISAADGSVFRQRSATAGVTRQFSTGTSIGLSTSDNRYEYSSPNTNPDPLPFHRDDLTISISQDLLRNAFGVNQRRQYDIARENSTALRESIADQISRSAAGSLVAFWRLAYSSETVRIQNLQTDNSKTIRNLVTRRVRIGLSEDYEIYQWNNNVINSENQLRNALTEREKQRLDLLRSINMESGFGESDTLLLFESMPEDVDEEKDISMALERRLDLMSVRRYLASSRAVLEASENNLLPSLTLNGSFSSRDWGRNAHSAYGQVPYGSYPQSGVSLRIDVPLWDESLKVEARNARIEADRAKLAEELMTRQVRDEVRKAILDLRNSYQIFSESRIALNQSELYYNRVLMRYQQGRAQTIVLNLALNSLVQAKQNLNTARINFNIAMVQYDVARNYLFERYSIDMDRVTGTQQ